MIVVIHTEIVFNRVASTCIYCWSLWGKFLLHPHPSETFSQRLLSYLSITASYENNPINHPSAFFSSLCLSYQCAAILPFNQNSTKHVAIFLLIQFNSCLGNILRIKYRNKYIVTAFMDDHISLSEYIPVIFQMWIYTYFKALQVQSLYLLQTMSNSF